MNLTDPTGLRVCFLGSRGDALTLSRYNQEITQTSYVLDLEGCVVDGTVKSIGKDFTELGRRFFDMARNPDALFMVQFDDGLGSRGAGSPGFGGGLAFIENGSTRYTISEGPWGQCTGKTRDYTSPQEILAHEFYGHVWLGYQGIEKKGAPDDVGASAAQNLYLTQAGKPNRCKYP